MPNLKLTELPTLSPINFDSSDLLYIVDTAVNASRAIPFSLLAGDSLTILSAYDTLNTTNVEFLSTKIQANQVSINSLVVGDVNVNTRINNLSADIDVNTANIDTVSAIAIAADTGTLQTDVLSISGALYALSATVQEDEDNNDVQSIVQQTSANVDYLSSQIDLLDFTPTSVANSTKSVTLPNGLIMKFGKVSAAPGTSTVNFSDFGGNFTSSVFSVVISHESSSTGSNVVRLEGAPTTSSFVINNFYATITCNVNFVAMGV